MVDFDAMVGLAVLRLRSASDQGNATRMAAYMKTDMPFYGVQKPGRTEILREINSEHPIELRSDYEAAVSALWHLPHREEKYLALGVARAYPQFISRSAVPMYRRMIVEGAWWDFVDEIAIHLSGRVLFEDRSRMTATIRTWSNHRDLWLRRSAIIAQIGHKSATDEDLLFSVCLSRADEREFFIRKAIGWALRDYARTAPGAVTRFLDTHEGALSPLSVREGGKHLER